MAFQSIRLVISKIKRWLPVRFWLAGPLAFILSVSMMAAAALLLPHDDSHLYHMIFPIIIFPLLWCGCFFYPLLTPNLKRASLVMLGLLIINSSVIALFVIY